MRYIQAVAATLILVVIGAGQTKYGTDVKLDRTKPSAFITFERFGTAVASIQPEAIILLRFRNNSVWNLNVDTVGCKSIMDECELFYSVHKKDGEQAPRSEQPYCHVCTVRSIAPHESVLFSIPAKFLTKELFITVEFNYEWESSSGGSGRLDNLHRAAFFGDDIPVEKK